MRHARSRRPRPAARALRPASASPVDTVRPFARRAPPELPEPGQVHQLGTQTGRPLTACLPPRQREPRSQGARLPLRLRSQRSHRLTTQRPSSRWSREQHSRFLWPSRSPGWAQGCVTGAVGVQTWLSSSPTMQVSLASQQSTAAQEAPVGAQAGATFWQNPAKQASPLQHSAPGPQGPPVGTQAGSEQMPSMQTSRSQQRALCVQVSPARWQAGGSATHAPRSSMQIEPSGQEPQEPPQPAGTLPAPATC